MTFNSVIQSFPWYNLFAGLALIAGIYLYRFNARKIDDFPQRKDFLIIIMGVAAVAGFALSNVAGWFFYSGLFELTLLDRIRAAGFTFYAGLLVFIAISWRWMVLFGFKTDLYFNEIVPSITLFHAIARIGCILAGCCYGIKIDFQLLSFTISRFPVREIEIIFLLIMTVLFQIKILKNRLIIYLAGYSLLRLILEFFRGDDRGYLVTGVLSPTQEMALAVLIFIMVISFPKLKSIAKK
ncbi:MAG TPA: prolipoprotein diacylglyceryl transferase [Spirochaetota bacterium]|nr:prolipoprotein diacylglyceryl transferase [Spirochaetota bacterium]